ncbi:MAG: type transport system permease protein [Actinomycetota bacterium]|nr:type transport system permease protein [Actinomycetota bacterium]
MSTDTATRTSAEPGTTVGGSRLKWAFADALVIMRRNLLRFVRIPALFVFSVVQPLMFVLLFRYVFGGNLAPIPGVDYVNFLIPGIFVQTAIFGSTNTGIGLAEDLNSGIIDRFRSLPMARSAVLAGRTFADLGRNFVVVCLMIAVGYLVGFSFQSGPIDAVAAVVLSLAVGYAFSWVSASIGLAIKDTESVQAASFTWIFPLTFISSALVPVTGMPSVLQTIARNNPVTIWANTVRYLTVGRVYDHVHHVAILPPPGDTPGGLLLKSALWIIAILLVFVPISVRLYRKVA